MNRSSVKRRLVALRPKKRGPALCDCDAQLQAIGDARTAITDEGCCEYCGRPVSANWGRFVEGLERVYGEVKHAN